MNTNYTTIIRTMILHFHFNNRIKYDHNHAMISQRDSTMGKPLWNTTSGVPQWLAHDRVPQWYSTTGASENVTPGGTDLPLTAEILFICVYTLKTSCLTLKC